MSSEPPIARASIFNPLRRFATALVVIGLLASNVMTLVNDSFHKAAYGFLTTIGTLAGSALLSSALANSPTKAFERKSADLRKENSALKRRVSSHNRTIAKLNGSIGKYKVSVGKYKLAIAKYGRSSVLMREALASSQKARSELTAKAARRTQAVKAFRASTVNRIARNKAVEISSLPERAVPYAGVAIMLGVTAYELNSDCEMLKEMNVLSSEHELQMEETGSICGFKIPTLDEVWAHVSANANSMTRAVYDQLAKLQ